MKVGITGARGLLGRSLLQRLGALAGVEVKALVRGTAPPVPAPDNVQWMIADLARPEDCATFVEDLDVIVHFAHKNSPLTSEADWSRDVDLNLLPTLNLLTAIGRAGRRPHVVYPSSGGAVYGLSPDHVPFREENVCAPENSYGIQKLAAEHYLRIMSERKLLTATVLRIGNAYGWILPPQRLQGFIGTAVHRVLHHQPIRVVGNPENVRDYVHVDDICNAMLAALSRRIGCEVFNIGTGVGTSVSEILAVLERLCGRSLEVSFESILGADRLPPWCVLDGRRAAAGLGWRAVISLEQGIQRMLQARSEPE
jgi:UDP-glucose 4-epimerase